MSRVLTKPVRGPAERAGTDHADCGKLAATAIIRNRFPTATVEAPDNATALQLVQAIRRVSSSIVANVVGGNVADVVNHWVPAGYYVLGLVHCDGQANPVPKASSTARHWVAVYGNLDGEEYYQCWDATYRHPVTLRADSVEGSGVHVVVKLPPLPKPPQPPKPPTAGVPPLSNQALAVTLVRGAQSIGAKHIPVGTIGKLEAAFDRKDGAALLRILNPTDFRRG